jgi:4'-phosphopantetheinyl transferase
LVQFITSAWGKPALVRVGAAPDLRFNLSHCDDLAAYVFAIGHEVGIDVERVRALPGADAIAERCFSRREAQAYRALAAPDRPLGFFNCWTRKEAFVKARGDGLGCALDEFDVSLAPGEPARILRVGEIDGAACGWSLIDCPTAPGFVGAIAVSVPTRPCEAWSARSTW